MVAWGRQYLKEADELLFVAEESFKTATAKMESMKGAETNYSNNWDSPLTSLIYEVRRAKSNLQGAKSNKEKLEAELAAIGPDAVYMKPELKALIPRLMKVYGISKELIEQLLFALSKMDRWSVLCPMIEKKVFDSLPTIDTSQSKTRLGHGGVGTVFQNAVNPDIAYKAMVVTTSMMTRSLSSGDRRPGIRDYLVESFIQAVLSLDPETEPYVNKLYNVYRYGPVGGTDTGVVLKIEKLSPLFPSKDVEDDDLVEVYMNAEEALKVINRNYEFKHGDFHLGNLMKDEDGALKIIDFGFSSLKIAGVDYRSSFFDYNEGTNMKHLINRSLYMIKDEKLRKRLKGGNRTRRIRKRASSA